MRAQFWRNSLLFAFGTSVFGLSSCGAVKKSSTCNLEGRGLTLAGYSGENTSSLQLSLVFLKGPTSMSEAIGLYLQEEGVSATFFIEGQKVKGEEGVVEELAHQGHRIGSGGFSFTALKDAEDPVLELKAADEIITPFAYGRQFWLYGEAGSLDEGSLLQLNRAGLGKYIGPIHADTKGPLFQSDEQCWTSGTSVSSCAEGYFIEIVRLGQGIIPFHDEDPRTLEMMKALVPELKAYGFTFARLDQIPELRLALTANGGIPDAVKGAEICHDYQ